MVRGALTLHSSVPVPMITANSLSGESGAAGSESEETGGPEEQK